MNPIINVLKMEDGRECSRPKCEIAMRILKAHEYNNVNEKLLWNNTGREKLYSMLPVELAVLIEKARALMALEDDSTAFAEKLNEFTAEEKQELINVGYLQEETELPEQEPVDDSVDVETVQSVQEPADENTEEETVSGEKKKVTVKELIERFLTNELVEELAQEVGKLPKDASLDVFKKEIVEVLCRHIKPSMVADSTDDDKVARWSIKDLSTILSMGMLSEFAQTPNVKKKTAIEAAVNKYGKATVVTYGLLVSNITLQLVMALYN